MLSPAWNALNASKLFAWIIYNKRRLIKNENAIKRQLYRLLSIAVHLSKNGDGKMLTAYMEIMPVVASTAFVAESAEVIGNVVIGANSSIWFGAVVRGDMNNIRVGTNTNIQDRCVLHGVRDKYPVLIGNEVTIGHGAIIHGCNINDRVLIGMGAIILGGAIIGEESIVGAGALVVEDAVIPPRSLVVGSPAKIKRQVTDDEIIHARRLAQGYVELAQRYCTARG
jgi:gamma-carbonic anhydrase